METYRSATSRGGKADPVEGLSERLTALSPETAEAEAATPSPASPAKRGAQDRRRERRGIVSWPADNGPSEQQRACYVCTYVSALLLPGLPTNPKTKRTPWV